MIGGALVGRGWASTVHELQPPDHTGPPAVRKVAVEHVPGLEEAGDVEHLVAAWQREIQALTAARGIAGVPVLLAVHTQPRTELWLTRMPGTTAAEVVEARGPLPRVEVLRAARGLAVILDELHARGWLHLDINPANVLLHESGPTLVDFGAAQRIDSPGQWSWPLGRHRYMAPEHIGGRLERPRRYRDLGPAADLYQLACLVAFLITGREPFEPCRMDEDYRSEYLERVAAAARRPGSTKIAEILDRRADLDWCRAALSRAWEPDHRLRPSISTFLQQLEESCQ